MSGRPIVPIVLWADGRVSGADNVAWVLESPGAGPVAGPREGRLLPLAAWQAADPAARAGAGLWLAPADDPRPLAGQLDDVPIVAVDFPTFKDGRGYSIAALLRSRLRYAGDLRAVGDVLIDQLHYLKRVGFTSFALRADQKVADAVAALRTFSEAYQGAADGALPLFRRRPSSAAGVAR
jgi:uncharacterized protein (DUF934 family)